MISDTGDIDEPCPPIIPPPPLLLGSAYSYWSSPLIELHPRAVFLGIWRCFLRPQLRTSTDWCNSLFSNLANKQLLWREGAKKQMSTLPSLRVPSLNPPLEALSPFFEQRAQFEFIHRLHPTSIGWQCLDSAPWKHCQVLKDLWRCFSMISQGVSSEDKKAKLPGMKAIIKQKVDKLKIK